MGEAIGGFFPYAVGVAISPIPIAGVLLMLVSKRARTNGPMFLLGWLVGLTAVGVVVLLLPGLETGGGEPSTAAGIVKGVLGLLLLFVGIRAWRNRPAAGEEAKMPGWMEKIDAMNGPAAMGIAVLLLCLLVLPEEAGARNPIRSDFFARYPNAAGTQLDGLPSDSKHCGVCHFDFAGGGPRNPYGLGIEGGIGAGLSPDSAMALIESNDSDADGFSNLVEITTCPEPLTCDKSNCCSRLEKFSAINILDISTFVSNSRK